MELSHAVRVRRPAARGDRRVTLRRFTAVWLSVDRPTLGDPPPGCDAVRAEQQAPCPSTRGSPLLPQAAPGRRWGPLRVALASSGWRGGARASARASAGVDLFSRRGQRLTCSPRLVTSTTPGREASVTSAGRGTAAWPSPAARRCPAGAAAGRKVPPSPAPGAGTAARWWPCTSGTRR
jgi:hypothetical protein